jgi:hypothetical protein
MNYLELFQSGEIFKIYADDKTAETQKSPENFSNCTGVRTAKTAKTAKTFTQSTSKSNVAPDVVLETGSQGTLEAAGAPPREGATWDGDQCVWRWNHWIMRTRASIELEKSMLGGTSAPPVKLPAPRPYPATPDDIALAESIMRIANTFPDAQRLRSGRFQIEGKIYDKEEALLLAAHRNRQNEQRHAAFG